MVPDQNETPRENLLKSMKRTKGVRFNASKRLEKSEKTKTAVIAYASASVIVLTILPAFFTVPAIVVGFLALATVGMSVVILAATLIQNSDAGMVKSDQFHRCALEVNALRRRLMTSNSDSDVADASAQYSEIMQRYGLNHDPVDYDRYQREHLDEFPELATQLTDKTRVPEDSTDSTIEKIIPIIMVVTGMAIATSVATGFEGVLPDLIDFWRQLISRGN